ncbi:MAG: PspC domain-containing protein [Eggerthellaceae bacterium]|nr:PspC domain-containing protein [Eggerthellaceae bacterium]
MCGGVADYFGMDAIVARIVAVAGTVLSGGLLGVAYAAMVMVVPKAPDCASCYDVRPQAAVSDKSGPIPVPQSPGTASPRAQVQKPYCSVGHIPPEPPAGARRESAEETLYYEIYQAKQ